MNKIYDFSTKFYKEQGNKFEKKLLKFFNCKNSGLDDIKRPFKNGAPDRQR